jgi:hypothetical protein
LIAGALCCWTDEYKHLFAEDSALLVEQLVLSRSIRHWAIHLPNLAKTDTRQSDLLFATVMPATSRTT